MASKRQENYEFLDHTADIQIHSWGGDVKEAFENAAVAMGDYITELSTVTIGQETVVIEAEAHDLDSLLYTFLDEVLFHFNGDYFVCKRVEITSMDLNKHRITAVGYGETFDLEKHPQGTEIKAITYSNMQIHQSPDKADVYVIVDI
mmetsp:Transcript_33978/g.95639  ORF Transcript_33978/g.95639 Transcript_33978/m.95639 type:complete len:147 (+) Transcript_33978:130-570(+)